jgi:PAS domain S-box-containing protein
MTDRPAEHRYEGFGSFELELETGAGTYSAGLRRILAAPAELPLTRGLFLERVHPEDREAFEAALEATRRDHGPLRFEVRVNRFDEVERVVRGRGEVIAPDGGRAKLVGTLQDVTDEAAARSARDLLSYVVQSTGDAIVTKSADGRITSWNGGAEQLYGYTAEEAIGQQMSLIEPAHRSGEQRKIIQTVFSGQSIDNLETERVRKDGSVIAVSLTASPVTDANGRIVSAAIVARDTTDRVRYEERLRHMADHDQLTGLFNRPLRRAAQARARSRRSLRGAQCRAEHRHRQFQGNQRLRRPRRRRCRADPCRAGADRALPRHRRRRSARGGRVRRAPLGRG